VVNPKKSFKSLVAESKVEASDRSGRSHGRATQATVAVYAGVTTMTVSRFLRSPGLVAPETARRIRAALGETGYTPNKQAGMLATGRSTIVAAIIPSIASSIFAETVQGLSDRLQAHGLELLLASTNYSLEREEEQIRAVLGWSPAGLVVTGRSHTPAGLALMHGAQRSGTPVLEIWDHDPTDHSFAQIGFSHASVGAMMAAHLVRQGYSDLKYVDSGVFEDFRAHERGQAFAAAARSAGAAVSVYPAEQIEPMQAGRLALQAVQKTGLPRAMAFANDHLAAGAFLQAIEQGIRIPEDLALLGFGDFPISKQLGSGLCTISVKRYDIGSKCAEVLIDMRAQQAAGHMAQPQHSEIYPELVHRNST
jgi:LacI family gluconate utilization system Gnt-I transcriptional repressor